jgi:hypothetical protein
MDYPDYRAFPGMIWQACDRLTDPLIDEIVHCHPNTLAVDERENNGLVSLW